MQLFQLWVTLQAINTSLCEDAHISGHRMREGLELSLWISFTQFNVSDFPAINVSARSRGSLSIPLITYLIILTLTLRKPCVPPIERLNWLLSLFLLMISSFWSMSEASPPQRRNPEGGIAKILPYLTIEYLKSHHCNYFNRLSAL